MTNTLAWAPLDVELQTGFVLQIQRASSSAPNMVIVAKNKVGCSHWYIELWSDDKMNWVVQDTEYTDLDEAKAVAVALAAMQEKDT